MPDNEKIIEIKDLNLYFDNDFGTKKILNHVSFFINRGETLGIVGESGCGKSVTSLSIMRLLSCPPARLKGEILFKGNNLLALSEVEMQQIRGNSISMIFQEPMTSLNPVYTIGDQLSETFMLHQKLNRFQAKKKSIEMLEKVNVPEPAKRFRQYPHELSGGMRQRIMIAMALSCRPELLIADEPTTALDVTIQAQVLDLMRSLQKEMGTAIAFITHDLGVVSEMCNRVIVMYCGEVVEEAATKDIFSETMHPYTVGLLSTLPKIGSNTQLNTIPGMVPPAGHFPKGCVFSTRCSYADDRCRNIKPALVSVKDGHSVRCFRFSNAEEK